MTAKLEIRSVSKSFGDLEVLRDISCVIDDHEFVAIVGPSGCGKTTLLRTIAGIVKPDTGTILIDGRALQGPGPDRGFVFQQDSLFPWRTIWKNAVFGLEVAGRLDDASRSRTRKILDLVGLSGFDKYYPAQISGGMRQRTNLARALAINPEVLIMDEPFSALDAQTREVMQIELLRIWLDGQTRMTLQEELTRIWQERRPTILFITHDVAEAVFLADRVIVLGRRPGWVKETIDIALPRPRALPVKRTPEFAAYVERIWNLIEKDVHASLSEEKSASLEGVMTRD
jgi:NitT/TauT family transport system ATP-binding protein